MNNLKILTCVAMSFLSAASAVVARNPHGLSMTGSKYPEVQQCLNRIGSLDDFKGSLPEYFARLDRVEAECQKIQESLDLDSQLTDCNEGYLTGSKRERDSQLLHCAIDKHYRELALNLIKEMAVDVNAVDELGNTPLHKAITDHYSQKPLMEELVKELIKAGADVNKKNLNGVTPLQKMEAMTSRMLNLQEGQPIMEALIAAGGESGCELNPYCYYESYAHYDLLMRYGRIVRDLSLIGGLGTTVAWLAYHYPEELLFSATTMALFKKIGALRVKY